MKIKSLCIMALVALATATTFSGCGGGGNNQDGYISAQKFASGGVVIRTSNTRSLRIAPSEKMAGGTGGYVVIPSESLTEQDTSYEVQDWVRCSGTIGAVGGSSYAAEFTFYTLSETSACILVTITSSSTTDDALFIASLGFGVNDLGSESSNTTGSSYQRATVNWIDDLTLQLLLDFPTSYMTIITSGAGYRVTYTDEDGAEHTADVPFPIRTQTTKLPYYIWPR